MSHSLSDVEFCRAERRYEEDELKADRIDAYMRDVLPDAQRYMESPEAKKELGIELLNFAYERARDIDAIDIFMAFKERQALEVGTIIFEIPGLLEFMSSKQEGILREKQKELVELYYGVKVA